MISSITSGVKFRLIALGLAVTVMGALIVLVTLGSQRQGAELRAKLDQVDSESFSLAERFKDMLREGSDQMTHYRNTGDPAAWQDFLKASGEMNSWIQAQIAGANTPHQQEILKQMSSTFADYQRIAGEVQLKIQAIGPKENLPADLTESLSQVRRRLFDLGQDLSQAHLDVKKQLMTEAHQVLTRLRVTILGAVALLFLFGIALAAFVYREMIAPLRSKLVETQAMVEQQEKMAALGLLAAGVAHEIRNPLTAIKAALFTQQKRFPPGTPEHSDVKVVEREISRLERIVSDFLSFARPSEPEPIVIAADLLLMEAKLSFGPQLAKNNIQVNQEPAVPMRVKVDPAQMKQVLINLVQNAADSIGHNGTITLRARSARKSLGNGETNVVVLEVADTGRGIPPEAQKRLFDPFFTTKENGTGLGLSIAAWIVEKHGGTLQYQTYLNQGTTFGIVLPQAMELE
jgi:signal transduction histidine kinase